MEEINFTPETTPSKPVVHPIDATKCHNLKEMGILINAMGLAMTIEYAEERGLSHLLILE